MNVKEKPNKHVKKMIDFDRIEVLVKCQPYVAH